MNVLYTTPVLEHPAAGGPQLRVENSIKALSKVCNLSVVSRVLQTGINGNEAEKFYRSFCKDFLYTPSAKGYSLNRPVRIMQKLYRTAFGTDSRFLTEYVDKKKIDVLWFGYGNISFPLIKKIRQIRPNLKLVCDTDSVWSRFVLRELPFVNDPERRAAIEKTGKEKELEEKEWVNICDITTAVSEVDAQYYRDLTREPDRIRIFSNVIDLDSYHEVPLPPPGFKKPCMYLAGTFGHINSPMDKAAHWVISEVLEKVRRDIPNMHFYIVGRGTEATLGAIKDPGITVTGKLSSVLPYLCHADVALVPLQFESGTRFKILEAGACGVPIISTTLGAEGIPVTHGRDIIIANKPEEFARGIVQIVRDKALRKTMTGNCKTLIRTHYSVESLVHETEAILKCLER